MGIGTTARKPVGQQTAYLRQRITRAGGASQTVKLGTLPAGANVLRVVNSTRVAFDGTTPVVSIGTQGTPAGLVASAANGLTAVGTTTPALVAGAIAVPDVDTDLYATFSVTGGTVGTADIQVEYTVPDETP